MPTGVVYELVFPLRGVFCEHNAIISPLSVCLFVRLYHCQSVCLRLSSYKTS